MKKILALMLAAVLALSLAACGGSGAGNSSTSNGGKDTPEEVQFSELALAAMFATKEVKNYLDENLKNPQSLAINSIKGGVTEDINFIFEIDYTAENGFGGSNREQMYITVTKSETSIGGYSILNYGDSTFSGSRNQSYTKQFYNKLASNGEIIFGEPGNEEAIETLLINPEDLAGDGIFTFNVDTILDNM